MIDIERDRPNACCNELTNLREEKVSDTLTIEHCRECGRRHFIAIADPVEFGLKVAGLS